MPHCLSPALLSPTYLVSSLLDFGLLGPLLEPRHLHQALTRPHLFRIETTCASYPLFLSPVLPSHQLFLLSSGQIYSVSHTGQAQTQYMFSGISIRSGVNSLILRGKNALTYDA